MATTVVDGSKVGAAAAEPLVEAEAHPSVLLVEDEATLRHILARNLARRGLRVREAATARQAVASVLEERPDLMVLDLNLPDGSGWDVLGRLRLRGVEVPTVVASAALVDQEHLADFRPLALLQKPFTLEALLGLVVREAGGSKRQAGADARQGGSYA